MVEMFVDEVDGASSDLDSVGEGLLLRVKARESGSSEGGFQDALREGLDEFGREQAHISGEADEVNLMAAQAGDDLGVMLGTLDPGLRWRWL